MEETARGSDRCLRARPRVCRAILALASVLAVVAVACGGGDNGQRTAPPPDTTLWVARSRCEELARVNAKGQVVARVDAGCRLRGVAAGAGGVWVSTDTGSVVRVDPASNQVVATIPVGTRAGALAVTTSDVWVSDLDAHEIVRIDAASNAITARISTGAEQAPVVGLVASGDVVWAIEDFALALVRIDPSTNTITNRVPLCKTGECRVGSLAVGAGRVWVVDCCTGEVLEVDPVSLDVATNAQLGRGVWELTGGADGVWALRADTGRLVELAPNRRNPIQVVETKAARAHYPQSSAGSVWFYSGKSSQFVRVTARGKTVTRFAKLTDVRAFAVVGEASAR
jgi:streptogramin lyase